jgi:hypothetical protein
MGVGVGIVARAIVPEQGVFCVLAALPCALRFSKYFASLRVVGYKICGVHL